MKPLLKLTLLLSALLFSASLMAQINPVDAQFFQNRYLANPAMAGFEQGLHLNLGYRTQWSNMPGSPINQNVNFESRLNKVGLGLIIASDKAGLLNYTKVLGTYAYHMPLNSPGEELHFGINFGVYNGTLSMQNVIGDTNDPDLVDFNERKIALDGDFGMVYSREKFEIEATFYNLKSQLKGDVKNFADNSLSYISAQYVFPVSSWNIISKLAFRGVRNYKDVIDIGLNAIIPNEKLGFIAIFHSNKSTSYGISYLHNQQWQLLTSYNTSAQPIRNYASETFEIGLKINLNNNIVKTP